MWKKYPALKDYYFTFMAKSPLWKTKEHICMNTKVTIYRWIWFISNNMYKLMPSHLAGESCLHAWSEPRYTGPPHSSSKWCPVDEREKQDYHHSLSFLLFFRLEKHKILYVMLTDDKKKNHTCTIVLMHRTMVTVWSLIFKTSIESWSNITIS